MYFTLAADLSVLSVNQHGAEQLGYTADELVGRPVSLVFTQTTRRSPASVKLF
jgi:PAS domain S-box-containing protein